MENNRIKLENINFNAKPPKPKRKSIILSIIFFPYKLMLAFLGINWEKLKKGDIPTRGMNTSVNNETSVANFKNQYKEQPSPLSPQGFDPIQAANLKMYLSGFDGKGDPQPCDHNER